jgi:CubicO group peptidase (beta-lactamase class C family)
VIIEPALTSVPGSAGSFFWGGAASTYFWIDREEEFIGILMTQLKPSAKYPLRALVRILTYQALID